jgi:hypothetical protein
MRIKEPKVRKRVLDLVSFTDEEEQAAADRGGGGWFGFALQAQSPLRGNILEPTHPVSRRGKLSLGLAT